MLFFLSDLNNSVTEMSYNSMKCIHPTAKNRKMSSECELCQQLSVMDIWICADRVFGRIHVFFSVMYHISSHMMGQQKEMSRHAARSLIKYSPDEDDLLPGRSHSDISSNTYLFIRHFFKTNNSSSHLRFVRKIKY